MIAVASALTPCRRPAQCTDHGFGPAQCRLCNPQLFEDSKMTTEDEKSGVRIRQEIPWSDLEPLLDRAKARVGTEKDVAHAVGWSASVFYTWRRDGKAPTTAWYALRGYLADTVHPFTLEDLSDLIRVAPTKELMKKLAKEIVDVT